MAPNTSCAIAQTRPAASPLRALAMAIDSRSPRAAASSTAIIDAAPAAAASAASSAMRCWIAWKRAIGRPNWTRSLAQVRQWSSTRDMAPDICTERTSAPSASMIRAASVSGALAITLARDRSIVSRGSPAMLNDVVTAPPASISASVSAPIATTMPPTDPPHATPAALPSRFAEGGATDSAPLGMFIPAFASSRRARIVSASGTGSVWYADRSISAMASARPRSPSLISPIAVMPASSSADHRAVG